MDNSPCHHGTALRPLLAAYRAVALYNIPHSSQYNAIELLWEHCKRPLRRLSSYPASRSWQNSCSLDSSPSPKQPLAHSFAELSGSSPPKKKT